VDITVSSERTALEEGQWGEDVQFVRLEKEVKTDMKGGRVESGVC